MKSVSSHAELIALGLSAADIRRLVDSGRLHRVRRGWFATPEADPRDVRAVRAGGAVTCVSALREYWTPPTPGLHLRIPANSRRSVVTSPDLIVHRLPRVSGTPQSATDPVPVALACAIGCLPPAEWVAVADSVLHRGCPRDELTHDLLRAQPDRSSEILRLMNRVNAVSESGTESLLRYDLESAKIPVRSQVWIGRDRVDLLVGDRLVLEADSVAHHTGEENYSRDRRRDQRLVSQGFLPLRFTWHQIIHERGDVVALVRQLCRAGEHRRRRGAVAQPR